MLSNLKVLKNQAYADFFYTPVDNCKVNKFSSIICRKQDDF